MTAVIKIHLTWNGRWNRPPNFQPLNRCSSAANCLISVKFGTEYNHVTPNVLQTFKVK